MSTEPIKQLLSKWKVADLTIEMAIGHLLQHVDMLHDTDHQANIQRHKMMVMLTEIQTSLKSLRHDVDSLIAHTGMPPVPPKRKRG
ncbi:hypothetical protein QUF64_10200 [Anaerolineales bacterium HSG6]|nr:hypothetical protein [Anaerolineales bacterium HSG6]MDM8531520.1 hypothetical protein [Anaerolineales bacterium HSG25]